MSTTTANVYFRPTFVAARSKASEAVCFFPLRFVSGLYSTALTNSNSKKNWKPSALTPVVDKDGRITGEWNRYFSDLGARKLGGANFPTLPELTEFFSLARSNSVAIAQLTTALENMVTANAQTTQALLEVVTRAELAGAAQIPPVVLVRQEITPNLGPAPFVEGGGAGGAGGD